MSKSYSTPKAFLQALTPRINIISQDTGYSVQRIRKIIAFEQFLTRLFKNSSDNWVLKGGFAMELRVQSARATKDVDLAYRDTTLLSKAEAEKKTALQEILQEQVQQNENSFFLFTVEAAVQDLDGGVYGGYRFPIRSEVNNATFERFNLDVAIGDTVIMPLEDLKGHGWLNFAGIEPIHFPSLSREQQFAEKIHAYTRPRPSENSRVKDLIDMILLIEKGLHKASLKSSIAEIFMTRKTHEIPINLSPPPKSWEIRYEKLALECGIRISIQESFEKLNLFFTSLQ